MDSKSCESGLCGVEGIEFEGEGTRNSVMQSVEKQKESYCDKN